MEIEDFDFMDHGEQDKRFCVYLHKDKDGVVRYVGSGTLYRATEKHNRNQDHKDIFDDLSIHIVVQDITKGCAIAIEQALIDEYFPDGNLLNRSASVPVSRSLDYMDFNEHFYYNPYSPSGLSARTDFLNYKKGDSIGFINSKGYWSVRFKTEMYFVHRIVYALAHKTVVPSNLVIDHIDRNRSNNLINNLRLITFRANCMNKTISRNNNTGIKNITWEKIEDFGRWRVKWSENGKAKTKSFHPRSMYPDFTFEEAKEKALLDAVAFRDELEKLNKVGEIR